MRHDQFAIGVGGDKWLAMVQSLPRKYPADSAVCLPKVKRALANAVRIVAHQFVGCAVTFAVPTLSDSRLMCPGR